MRTWGVWGSIVASGVLGCGSAGPVQGELACGDDDLVTVYRLDPKKASSVAITADTVAADTAFDPLVEVWTVDAWTDTLTGLGLSSFVDEGDDDVDCTFPPTDFSCPELSFSTPDTTEDLAVLITNLGSCVGTLGEYELSAVDGEGKDLKLDEVVTGPYGDLEFPDLP